MQPKVSIIIPCYNIALYLEQCVNSVLSQTFRDFELLLIDDGSLDNTLAVCKEYEEKDRRVKVFSHKNKGVSYTRNKGIELASGECILFIDGDDYVKPDFVEKLLGTYEEEVWTICGMINVKNGEAVENIYYSELLSLFPEKELIEKDFLKLLEYYSFSSPCCRIYFKKILIYNNILFDENISYQEDLLFNMEYIKYVNKVKLLPYFGYYYVEHETSSTSRFHVGFNHIERLYEVLKTMIKTEKDKLVVQEFIFQTILRRITNVFHRDSPKSKKEKLLELKEIFNSKSYDYIDGYIAKSNVNLVLKTVLKIRNRNILYFYFNR